jgi:2-hydroxycyclohexanecarboxyl-CoA dehydrogenase
VAKTALVTGAAAGIGKACAKQLAREGMAVGVLDVDLKGCEDVVAEIEAAGGKALALEASIANRPQVQQAVARLRETFGPVTVVVNNAGISRTVPFKELTDEQWDEMLEINLKGTFIVTQVVLSDMEEAQWGRIVNISSSSAQTGAVGMAHYSASKGAMIALTRTLARELGPLGITVNNIPPGTVMHTIMSEAQRQRAPEQMDAISTTIPVQRFGEPEDIANACAWLCSDETGYVTGQTIGVNGGRVVS